MKDVVIEENKTIPKAIYEEVVMVELNISVRKIFSSVKVNGDITIEGTTYKILSAEDAVHILYGQ